MTGTGSLDVGDCMCNSDFTKVQDLAEPGLFECAVNDKCTQSGSCPANAECFSNYAGGDPT
jgi:hypothetical protein